MSLSSVIYREATAEDTGALGALLVEIMGDHGSPPSGFRRRLLARIHQLTVATLRKQVEPVTAAQFMRWLLRWQHILPTRRWAANADCSRSCGSCKGLRFRRTHGKGRCWVRGYANYEAGATRPAMPNWFGGLGAAIATSRDSGGLGSGHRRVVPTSVAPITFFVREDSDWMQPRGAEEELAEERVLSDGAGKVAGFPPSAWSFVLCRYRSRDWEIEG